MNEPSQEPFATKSSWSPYMCPSCRGLFRAPIGKTGKAQCPLCESAIEILEKSTPDEQPQPSEPQSRKRRHKSASRTNSASWDQDSSKQKNSGASKGLILTTLFLISVLIGVSGFLLLKDRRQRLTSTTYSQGNQASPRGTDPSSERPSLRNFPSASNRSATEPLLELEPTDIEKAEKAAERFLNCETIEEFAPLIRDPERVMPLIREFYRQTPYQPIGSLGLGENNSPQVAQRFVSFSVVLKDYSSRLIALQITDTEALVDWESWVGYCAIPWESFIEVQVIKPTEVRVHVKPVFYYNFNFQDDRKWACFRLTTTSDESVIYGYAPRDASFLHQLPKENEPEATFVLKIRFPETAVNSNQVLITDLIQSGWVIGL